MLIRILKDVFSALRRERAKSRNTAVEAISDAGNPLVHWYAEHSGRLTEKWHHYLEIYHRHFQRFRGRSPVVLEIGVFHGGSLEMWRDYFGPGCRLFGIDIDPRCKAFEEAGTTILIGDQSDRRFLAQVREALPKLDILIDDGGHTMNQQIATFEELYQHIADDGVYLCEDLHTSYISRFGGGYREPGSFIEFSKKLIDQLNAWYAGEGDGLQVDHITRTTYAMHYYDSVVVIEKRPMAPPRVIVAGRSSF